MTRSRKAFIKFTSLLLAAYAVAVFIVVTHARQGTSKSPAEYEREIKDLRDRNGRLSHAAQVALTSLRESNVALKEAMTELERCRGRK